MILCVSTTRITVTLPTEQVAAIRQTTDNASAFVADAVANELRWRVLGTFLDEYQAEQGSFTDEELQKVAESMTPYRPAVRMAA